MGNAASDTRKKEDKDAWLPQQQVQNAAQSSSSVPAASSSSREAASSDTAGVLSDEELRLRWPFLMYDIPTVVVPDDEWAGVTATTAVSASDGAGGRASMVLAAGMRRLSKL